MKMILIALAVVAVVIAAPPVSDVRQSQIVRSEFKQNPEGSYNFAFETDDGIVRSETGEVKETIDEENKPRVVVVMRGFYSYTDNEGNPVQVDYSADETGYHASGPSIPVRR